MATIKKLNIGGTEYDISTTIPLVDGLQTALNGKLSLTGGTMSGSINMNNNSITGLNNIAFADPGPNEGITWTSGNGWGIQESPDDLSTNTAGNLQFIHGSTRRLTINAGGYVDINARLVVRGNGSSYNEGIRILPASNGWSNIFFSADTSLEGTHDGGWLIGRRGAAGSLCGAIGDFTIEHNDSSGKGLTLHKNGSMTIYGTKISLNNGKGSIVYDTTYDCMNFTFV